VGEEAFQREGKEPRNNEWPDAVVTMIDWDHESLGIKQPLHIVQMHRAGEN